MGPSLPSFLPSSPERNVHPPSCPRLTTASPSAGSLCTKGVPGTRLDFGYSTASKSLKVEQNRETIVRPLNVMWRELLRSVYDVSTQKAGWAGCLAGAARGWEGGTGVRKRSGVRARQEEGNTWRLKEKQSVPPLDLKGITKRQLATRQRLWGALRLGELSHRPPSSIISSFFTIFIALRTIWCLLVFCLPFTPESKLHESKAEPALPVVMSPEPQ